MERIAAEAKTYSFASVCVPSSWVEVAHSASDGRACVVVGFPHGNALTEAKALEARLAVEAGAIEVDMVAHLGHIAMGNFGAVEADVAAVKKSMEEASSSARLKVILESGEWLGRDGGEAILRDAVLAAERGGADFVKTSTGFGKGGATIEAVELMRDALVSESVEVKASGGIRSEADARAMLKAGATRLGASSGLKIIGVDASGAAGGY